MRILTLFLLLLAPLSFGSMVLPEAKTSTVLRSGKDYALFFPVSDYSHPNLTALEQSVANATSIARELETSFGFQTEIVPNATYAQMVAKLQEYSQKFANGQLPADGQLFLYFSGHGMREFNSGYFLPADANPNSLFNTGLAYSYWRQFISNINCQHIMVAVDACYSVTFDPDHTFANYERFGRKGELTEAERILANHEEFKSRIFFSSDSKEDIVPGRSNFARKLLEGLRDLRSPDGFVTSSRLFSNYVELAQPSPRAADFEGDDPSATFLFFHEVKRDVDDERADLAAWQTAQRQDDCPAYRTYLQQFPYGDFATTARQKIAPCEAEERMLAAWQRAKTLDDCDSYTAFAKDYPQSPYAGLVPDKLKALGCGRANVPDNMIFVKGGTFQMGDQFGDGDSDEKPVHAVMVSDFYLSRTELTNREFAEFLSSQGNQEQGGTEWYGIGSDYASITGSGRSFLPKSGQDDHPVLEVSWYGAVAYCNWLSGQHGLKPVYRVSGTTVTPDWNANGYRLPTEAEWEYAARSGGKKEKWAGTSTESSLSQFANYSGKEDGYDRTSPVGVLRANNLGLADMSGNVWEWCWDWHDSDYYGKSPTSNPRGADSGSYRVFRGGSWDYYPRGCRAAHRSSYVPAYRNSNVGVRLARSF